MPAFQFNEDLPCLYCGCSHAHCCSNVPVCDNCCIDLTDIVIAVPKAQKFIDRIIEFHVHGNPAPAPQWIRIPPGVNPKEWAKRRMLERQSKDVAPLSDETSEQMD
jgi:hypothetical protein